ncbi:MAG: glycosyltransferase family 4 protein [Motiliproteus sp.]|nr:glycosyltransferase family 4 protein [Motiliproteus sp.]MCW9052388.1 glycosyltransferase family 4 protein [Motiliproteus sp.]
MANQTAELIRRLEGEDAEVSLVAVNSPYKPTWISKLRGIRALFRLLPYLFNLWRKITQADLVHLMANSGWSWHLFAAPAIWIAWLTKTPLVLNYRGGHAEEFFSKSWWIIKPSMQKVSHIVVPSNFLKSVFANYSLTTTVVPNTLDEHLFSKRNVDELSLETITIAVTRNLEHIYGIDLAIGAMAKILQKFPEAELVVAGSGDLMNELQEQARSLGIAGSVKFTGRLSREQIAALYKKASLLLNPSRVDNSPNSLIEAMGCGVPIVSTMAGGIPQLVTHNTHAYLVEEYCSDALAHAAVEVLSSPELQAKFRKNGLSHSEQFRWPQVKRKISSVYQQVIDPAL